MRRTPNSALIFGLANLAIASSVFAAIELASRPGLSDGTLAAIRGTNSTQNGSGFVSCNEQNVIPRFSFLDSMQRYAESDPSQHGLHHMFGHGNWDESNHSGHTGRLGGYHLLLRDTQHRDMHLG